ncbi:MAG: twin-arginine translocase subunit TatC, partial [Dehalococcoidia bacterium]|nr:twin-arginine translocase subunit TatC [Dehalococcoidia bacterium]
EELRRRLTRSAIAVALATAVAFAFADHVFNILKAPAGSIELVFIEMTEMLSTYVKVCIASGIVLSMPYLAYQFFAFVAPALTDREKRYLYIILPWVTGMFLCGVVFAYFVLLPPAINVLLNFGSDIATPQIRVGNYISLVTRITVITGILFELPVVTTFLSRLGIISPRWLAQRRKAAILLSFILAAIVTPTTDPVNQALIAGTMIALFEMSIWLAKIFQRRQVPRTALPRPTTVKS